MAGLLAKELGGESRAQVLAAVAVAGSSLFLMLGHLLSTATIDAFIWVVILYLATKILKGGDPRLWLLVGAGFGVGMLNSRRF